MDTQLAVPSVAGQGEKERRRMAEYLRRHYARDKPELLIMLEAYCPACLHVHQFYIHSGYTGMKPTGVPGDIWEFNGDYENPTFTPSMGHNMKGHPGHPRCHSWLRDGQWHFQGDCTHEMAGQTVAVIPFPDDYPEAPDGN